MTITLFLLADAPAPPNVLAQDFFFGFLAIALLGLAVLVYGLLGIKREQVRITKTRNELLPQAKFGSSNDSPPLAGKIWARSKGVGASFHETLAIRDLMPGLKARNPDVIQFALRGGGLAVFVLFGLLAAGAGVQALDPSNDGSGWGIIGFVILFIIVQGYRIFKTARSKTE